MTERPQPVRLQLSRRKGWRMPPDTVKIDRTTKWGNPFVVGEPDPDRPGEIMTSTAECVQAFRRFAERALAADARKFEPLRGKNLACWCALDGPCHGDILLEFANAGRIMSDHGNAGDA